MSTGRLVRAVREWETLPRRALVIGPPAALAADNESSVNLLSDVIDRLGHRVGGFRDPRGGTQSSACAAGRTQ